MEGVSRGEEKREKKEKFKEELQWREEQTGLDILNTEKKEKKEKKDKKEKKEKEKEKDKKEKKGKEKDKKDKKEKETSKEETEGGLKGGYPQASVEGMLELHVTYALSGASLGHFRRSGSDSVQELKLEIAKKISAQRPWTAFGEVGRSCCTRTRCFKKPLFLKTFALKSRSSYNTSCKPLERRWPGPIWCFFPKWSKTCSIRAL